MMLETLLSSDCLLIGVGSNTQKLRVPPWSTGTFRDYMATEYQLVISKLPAMLEIVLMARLIIRNKQNTYHIASDPAVCQID